MNEYTVCVHCRSCKRDLAVTVSVKPLVGVVSVESFGSEYGVDGDALENPDAC